MGRHQTGHIFESKSGAFHVRYYATEIVDGHPKRVQRSHLLCRKSDKYYSATCKAVKLLRDEFMRTINASAGTDGSDMKVADFWEKTYLPFAEENLKPSTVAGYEQIWSQHLRLHFADRTLGEYKTHMGSQFLLSLTKTQGRRTLNHIRSLGSGIFTHAVNMGLLESNPWHDVKILGKVKAPAGTPHYTLEEIENIVSALVDRVDCQLVMLLAFFVGLRPGEIAALRWEDFDVDRIHIRRSVWGCHVGTPKTQESIATLPLANQVILAAKHWNDKCGNPSEGWVFPNQAGNPVDLKELAKKAIRPTLAAKKIQWKGYYAGRRGAGTALVGLTNGNYAAAQELLRHKNMATTLAFYKRQTESALADGVRALSAASGISTEEK